MIGIREVLELSTADAYDEGLLLPVPGLEPNSIRFEGRDGTQVRHILAKALSLQTDGQNTASAEQVRIDVFITDARVALACSKYDKGGGWMGGLTAVALNVGSMALAAVRRRGKMLVGQVRYPWIANVGSTAKIGWLSEERLVLAAKGPNGPMRLLLQLPKDLDAASVAAEVARRAAAYRLACEPDLDQEERAKLEELAHAERLEPDATAKNQIRGFSFPSYWPIGEKSARLVPGAQFVGAGAATLPVGTMTIAAPLQSSPASPGALAARRGIVTCGHCGVTLAGNFAFCTQCGSAIGHA